MKSPLKQRARKFLFLVLILNLSAAWTAADPAAAAQEPGPGAPLPRAFHYADQAAMAVAILSQPPNYELPMRDPFTEMRANARCSQFVPRAIDVTLYWGSKRAGVVSYRVDITDLGDGFATGRYLTSGDRGTSVKELPFEEAKPGVYYYWRVLTKTADGWVVAGAGRFDAPICVMDEREENEREEDEK